MSTVEFEPTSAPGEESPDWVIETTHNLSMTLDGHNYLLLSDNGANSCLISRKAFHIDSIDPHRRAVIKGCKDSYISRGNPIGTGRAVVVGTDPRVPPIGIRINEAAIHHDEVSLLSEFQAREFGTVINSVARRHAKNDPLAQSLIPHPDVHIPFQVRQALMTLTIRRPTADELLDLKFHDLTSPVRWHPRDYNDDGQESFETMDAVAQTDHDDTPPVLLQPVPALDPPPVDLDGPPDPALVPPVEPAPLVVPVDQGGPMPNPAALRGAHPDPPGTDPDSDIFYDALSDHNNIGSPSSTKKFDPGGFHIMDFADSDNADEIFYDTVSEPSVTLQLDHAYLDTLSADEHVSVVEDEVDAFLNHLDNDALFGLQLRMSPIEFAIHTIQKRSQQVDTPSTCSEETVKTSNVGSATAMPTVSLPCKGPVLSDETTGKVPSTPKTTGEPEPEVPEEIEDPKPQEAPTVIVAKHNTEDAEKLRPYLAYLPIRVIKETLKRTTQLAKAIVSYPLVRHVAARFAWMNRFRLREKVSTDTMFAGTTAIGGFTCAQVFYGTTSRVINVYGMKSKSDFPLVYADFLRNEGIPTVLRRDNAPEEQSQAVTTINRKYLIKDEYLEAENQQQNPVELNAIKWLKRHTQLLLDRTNAPSFLWLHAARYLAQVHNVTAKETLRWEVPLAVRYGDTPDISAYLTYKFMEPVYYMDDVGFPQTREKLGHWIGVAEHVGDALCFQILTEKRTVINRSVLRSATPKDLQNKRLGETLPDTPQELRTPVFPEDEHPSTDHDDMNIGNVASDTNNSNIQGGSNAGSNTGNERRSSNRTNTGTTTASGESVPRTTRRSRRDRQNPSRLTVKDFGHTLSYFAAKIQGTLGGLPNVPVVIPNYEQVIDSAEDKNTIPSKYSKDMPIGSETFVDLNECSQEALDQFRYVKLCELWQEEEDRDLNWTPIQIHKHYVNRNNPNDVHVAIKVTWLNGESTIQRLNVFAVEHPDLVVAYAVNNDLQDSKPFRWTRRYQDLDRKDTNFTTLRDSPEMRALMNSRFSAAPKYKFGVQVPSSLRHALYLDRINGDNLWRVAIDKEINEINTFGTFREVKETDNLAEYKKIPYHIVFDVKFDGRRKARLVADGNHTTMGKEDVYSGVVGLDTIRLGFQLAAMNDLLVCAADVGTAFLYGYTKEKVYVIAGPEFGALQGKPLIIHRGIYGLRTSAARFHEHLALTIRKLGFIPSKADSDLYYRDTGGDSYEYLATYVDDILIFSKRPMDTIEEIKKSYNLKGVGEPQYYLGGDVIIHVDEHWDKQGVKMALSAETYIKNSVERLERQLDKPFGTSSTPMAEADHPELDDSPLCSEKEATLYRSMVGSANWIVTLGRFDIAFALQSLARFSMAPRVGHLKRMNKLFCYLKHHGSAKIMCDPAYPNHSQYKVNDDANWDDFYPDAQEELPPDMPIAKGKPARITCYVDADHAHCQVTRRSVTGIVVFMNNMPIRWYSKKQSTVETSTYGSELVAARIAVELILELRYALRMLGVPVNEPALLLGDNMSVVLNTTIPSSILKKKHNAICYHRVREACAAGIVRFAHIPSHENIADLCTKSLGKATFYSLMKRIFHRIPECFNDQRTRKESEQDKRTTNDTTVGSVGDAIASRENGEPLMTKN